MGVMDYEHGRLIMRGEGVGSIILMIRPELSTVCPANESAVGGMLDCYGFEY